MKSKDSGHVNKSKNKSVTSLMKDIKTEMEEIKRLEDLIKYLKSMKKAEKTAATKMTKQVWKKVEPIRKDVSMVQQVKKTLHLSTTPNFLYPNLAKLDSAKELEKLLKKQKPVLTSTQQNKLDEIIKVLRKDHNVLPKKSASASTSSKNHKKEDISNSWFASLWKDI